MHNRKEQMTNPLLFLTKGMKYIRENKWIWKYIFIAIGVGLILFIILSIVIASTITWILNYTFAQLGVSAVGVWESVILIIVYVISFVLAGRLFLSLNNIVNAPVYGQMAEEFLHRNNVKAIREYSLIKDILRSIFFELKKIFLVLLLLVLMLLLNIIPVLGQILTIVFAIFQIILFAGLDFFDPYLSRKNYRFRSKVKFVLGKPYKHYPFLLIAGFITSLPVFNIIFLPTFIVSGLLLAIEEKRTNLTA